MVKEAHGTRQLMAAVAVSASLVHLVTKYKKKVESVVSTSDLLFERHDDFNGHVEYAELSLGFVALQVRHAHPTEFF